MTNEQFTDVYYPKYAAVIKAIARKLAQRNDALMEELVSEGMIALWKVDPAKARDNPDAFIRQAIKFRMIDWMRKERPDASESLSPYLERGDQVVYDPDTNQPRMLRVSGNRNHRDYLYDNEEFGNRTDPADLPEREPDE